MPGVGRKPNTSPSPQTNADDPAYAALIARAKALIPRLSDRASRTEEMPPLSSETERDLHEAGLFSIVQPKRECGSGFDSVELVDCADAIGQDGASVSWY